MSFLQWLSHYAKWSTYGWLVIIAAGTYWEISGFLRKDGTTFTDLVRSTVPVEVRLVVLAVLIWHFCMGPANVNGPKWW